MTRLLTLAAVLSAMTLPAVAPAAILDVYDVTGPEMIVGDGIPIDNFTQTSVPPVASENTVSVALKARNRDTGQANAQIGNRYFVEAGMSTVTPTAPNLVFDYQFDPGVVDSTLYQLRLSVDFDPAFGVADFAVLQAPIFAYWALGDGYFENPGSGAWNDDSVPYVISNSWQLDYGFWSVLNPAAGSYDPNQLGEYEIRLEALDLFGTTVLASTTVFAQTVPEPSTVAILGLAGVAGLAMVRRRRQG